MNVNLHLTGKPAKHIDWLIKNGLAASKTEAIRLTVVRSMETEKLQLGDEELWSRSAADSAWNNPKDDAAEKFYVKRYLRGKKA
jgi:hypothetical protein